MSQGSHIGHSHRSQNYIYNIKKNIEDFETDDII